MALRATIQSLVTTAFVAVGDIAEEVEYHHTDVDPDYDWNVGDVTEGLDSPVSKPQVLFTPIPKSGGGAALEELVQKGALGKMLCQIPGEQLSREPTNGDKIIRSNGEIWLVELFEADPAKALWDCVVTRPYGGGDADKYLKQ